MNAQSNPSPCNHSMVTDLCGLCIRDQRIAELEQQRDELLDAIRIVRMYVVGEALPTKDQALQTIDKALAAHRDQQL